MLHVVSLFSDGIKEGSCPSSSFLSPCSLQRFKKLKSERTKEPAEVRVDSWTCALCVNHHFCSTLTHSLNLSGNGGFAFSPNRNRRRGGEAKLEAVRNSGSEEASRSPLWGKVNPRPGTWRPRTGRRGVGLFQLRSWPCGTGSGASQKPGGRDVCTAPVPAEPHQLETLISKICSQKLQYEHFWHPRLLFYDLYKYSGA